jgi:hypothetical protein
MVKQGRAGASSSPRPISNDFMPFLCVGLPVRGVLSSSQGAMPHIEATPNPSLDQGVSAPGFHSQHSVGVRKASKNPCFPNFRMASRFSMGTESGISLRPCSVTILGRCWLSHHLTKRLFFDARFNRAGRKPTIPNKMNHSERAGLNVISTSCLLACLKKFACSFSRISTSLRYSSRAKEESNNRGWRFGSLFSLIA